MGDKDGENFIVVNVLENTNIGFEIICLSDTLNCLGNIEDYLVVDESVEVENVLIYPNPMKEQFTLSCYQDCTVQLYNISGQLIHKQNCTRFDRVVNVSSFQKGFYIVKIIYKNSERVTKIIIE